MFRWLPSCSELYKLYLNEQSPFTTTRRQHTQDCSENKWLQWVCWTSLIEPLVFGESITMGEEEQILMCYAQQRWGNGA
jgi:hypothetical protein